jgi:hypothetical protein
MNSNSTLTKLVKSAQAGHTGSGQALAYALTGLISGAFPNAGVGYPTCINRGNYRMLSWKDKDEKEAFRIFLIDDGNIAFSRFWDNLGAESMRIFPSISRMIFVFREAARSATAESGSKPKCRIWPLNASSRMKPQG